MLKPNFEDPIDTGAQIIEKNLEPVTVAGGHMFQYMFSIHHDPNYRKIAKRMYIPSSLEDYYNKSKLIMEKGTAIKLISAIQPIQKRMGKWYKSKKKVPIPMMDIEPLLGYISRKKWKYNEESVKNIDYSKQRLYIRMRQLFI